MASVDSRHRDMTDQTSSAKRPSQLVKRHDHALLLVTFGSTYPGPHRTFARIRAFFAEAFPDRDIYMAFTSGMCMRRWYDKSGEQYYPADVWLEALGAAGYSRVSIQSLHIIPGLEYSFIRQRYLPIFSERYPHIPVAVGEPLLYSPEDITRVGDVIYEAFAQELSRGEALVLMGHGNSTDKFPEANGKYAELNEYLQSRDKKIVIGTVDYEAMLYEQVLAHLRAYCPPATRLNFLPLMSVAGDHALNDMVGDRVEGEPLEEQSWMVRLLAEGFVSDRERNCHLHGLGDYTAICQIWLDHLRKAEVETWGDAVCDK